MLSTSASAAATHLPLLLPQPSPVILHAVSSRTITSRRQQCCLTPLMAGFVSVKESGGFCGGGGSFYLGFPEKWSCGFVRRCKDVDNEGDAALEAEILEFMKRSKKPAAFPSKKELVEAGRGDLAEAISKKGGWLSLGWDLEEEEEKLAQDRSFTHWESIMPKESAVLSSYADHSSRAASSSGRSLEADKTEDDAGIEGILNRLEKERNLTFGISLRDGEESLFVPNNSKKNDLSPETSTDVTVAGLFRSSGPASLIPNKATLNDSIDRPNNNRSPSDIDVLRDSPRPEWRTWSSQRAGLSDLDFEAAEISYDKMGGPEDASRREIFQIREGANEPDQRNELDSHQEKITHKQIRSRIKYLESELSSALRLLRSKADEAASQEGNESSSDELRKLSDAWELQENEIMHAQDKLRSTRAKLAVLEGKMALAMIEAQKIVEEKQKRINDAHRALRLLRTAYIVWQNPASEVLIVGSYDGWTTQRKMEKSSTGLFSLCLKLYPGRYEIKFIIDGKWRIDPLRPIVHSSGYENNVLIIT